MPEWLTRLERLRWLNASGNRLTSLPAGIERMGELIRLDLRWRTTWTLDETVEATGEWYATQSSYPDDDASDLSTSQVVSYATAARSRGMVWAWLSGRGRTGAASTTTGSFLAREGWASEPIASMRPG